MPTPKPKEIRECFSDYRSAWQPLYDEGDTDMRFVNGDPWDPDDRAEREEAGRPCLSLDEINQYLNQYINNLRQSPRAIQLTPKGDGANDQDAKRRSSIVRGIEDSSNAQGAYITAAENAVQRSYGFVVLRTEFKDNESFDQCIRIRRIANPNTALICPNYKEADASDIEDGFLLDRITKASFKAKYPKAEIQSFTDELLAEDYAGDWVDDKTVQIAEYWKIEHDHKNLYLVRTPTGELVILNEEEFKQAKAAATKAHRRQPEIARERRVEIPKVMQYLTNGLEILDEIPWAGSRVPIISCFGKEIFVNEGGRAQRKLLSMVRLARDPQMLFAYLATQECEEAGLVPKVPFIGYKGQFESDVETWETLNKTPHAFAQVDIVIDQATGQVLPVPQRPQYVANFQQYEIAKDSARRSIQAAMGIMPLPTAAQRKNEKSGEALRRIETTEQIGSFHFTDNFERFLHNVGWQVNELIKPILDTERTEPVVKPDGTRATMQLVGNTSHPVDESGAYEIQGLDEDHMHTGRGTFDVTIKAGPSFQDEREEQSDFVDHLIENWQALAIPGPIANKVLAKAIRMKNIGAVGEDIANMLDPPDPQNLSPQAQAIVAQLQGKMQLLQQENAALHMDRAGRILEQKTKVQIEAMRGNIAKFEKNLDYITQIVKAQLAAKSKADGDQAAADAQRELAELGFHHDQIDRAHDAAHDVAMSGVAHRNAMEQADQAATHGLVAQEAAAAQQPEAGAGGE